MPDEPLYLTPYDFSRSYALPDSVDSNIPHRGSVEGPGAWTVARGVLAELCHALDATPLSLRYQELLARRDQSPIGIRITAHALHPGGRHVIVVYRSENNPSRNRRDYWSVTVNGLIPAHGHGPRPSPPWIARLAHRTVGSHLDS